MIGGALLALVDVSTALLVIAIVVSAGLLGFMRPEIVAPAYRLWNRLAHRYASATERLLLWICYWTVIVAAGQTKSSLRLARPRKEESLWVPRRTADPSSYRQLHSCPDAGGTQTNWLSNYLGWASSSKQPWLLALLPFIWVLMWLKPDEEVLVRESIYTLF
jgi:hypothetical protein